MAENDNITRCRGMEDYNNIQQEELTDIQDVILKKENYNNEKL